MQISPQVYASLSSERPAHSIGSRLSLASLAAWDPALLRRGLVMTMDGGDECSDTGTRSSLNVTLVCDPRAGGGGVGGKGGALHVADRGEGGWMRWKEGWLVGKERGNELWRCLVSAWSFVARWVS